MFDSGENNYESQYMRSCYNRGQEKRIFGSYERMTEALHTKSKATLYT